MQDTERPSPPLAAPPARLRLESSDGYLLCRAIASLAYSFIATRRGKEITDAVACHGLLAAWPVAADSRQWIKFSAYTGSYHYSLSPDPYDICIGITHQSGG